MNGRTIFSLLDEAVAAYGAETAALHQPVEGEDYRTYTWGEFREIVRETAAGLRAMGIRHGDVVAIGSETRAEFYFSDLGAMTCGALAAAMYSSTPASEQVEALRACGAKMVLLESPKLLRAMRAAGGDGLEAKWGLLTGEEEGAASLAAIRELGRKAMEDDPDLFPRMREEVSPADYAILYLTSGATGQPKMVLVTHGALVANVDMGPKVIEFNRDDRALAFLPSAHIAQRVGVELLPLRMGLPVWFSESLARLPHEFRTIRPTFFLAPPRVWERIYSSICTEINKRGAMTRNLFYWALGLGSEAVGYRQEGKPIPGWLRQLLKAADRLVFRKIRERFGGRLRFPISGAAPLGKNLGLFYASIGMPLIEGYGLTEGGILSLNPPDNPRLGSIGKPFPGVEMKIAEDGELLIRSETLASGYYQDPDASAAVFRDGWLYTGDLAEISQDGFVAITGRKKEMIVSSNGKKIYPIRVECLFKTEPVVSQMMLLGDRQPYVTALFTVNVAAAESLKGMEGMRGRTMPEVANAPPVIGAVKKAVARANKQLAPFEQIRKFRILERDFAMDQGELTATMKVRRAKVLENFRDIINELYSGREEDL